MTLPCAQYTLSYSFCQAGTSFSLHVHMKKPAARRRNREKKHHPSAFSPFVFLISISINTVKPKNKLSCVNIPKIPKELVFQHIILYLKGEKPSQVLLICVEMSKGGNQCQHTILSKAERLLSGAFPVRSPLSIWFTIGGGYSGPISPCWSTTTMSPLTRNDLFPSPIGSLPTRSVSIHPTFASSGKISALVSLPA